MLGSPELEAMCGRTAAPSVGLSIQRADVHVTRPGLSVESAWLIHWEALVKEKNRLPRRMHQSGQ